MSLMKKILKKNYFLILNSPTFPGKLWTNFGLGKKQMPSPFFFSPSIEVKITKSLALFDFFKPKTAWKIQIFGIFCVKTCIYANHGWSNWMSRLFWHPINIFQNQSSDQSAKFFWFKTWQSCSECRSSYLLHIFVNSENLNFVIFTTKCFNSIK